MKAGLYLCGVVHQAGSCVLTLPLDFYPLKVLLVTVSVKMGITFPSCKG